MCIRDRNDTCIHATDNGTFLSVTECKFQSAPDSKHDTTTPTCNNTIRVMSEATAELSKLKVEHTRSGVLAHDRAALNIRNSTFREYKMVAVAYQEHSTGEVSGCMLLGQGPHTAADLGTDVSTQPDIAGVAIVDNCDVKLKDIKLLRQREFGVQILDSRVECTGLRSRAGGCSPLHTSDSEISVSDFESTGDGDGINLQCTWGTISNATVQDCTSFLGRPGCGLSVHGRSMQSTSDSSGTWLHVTDFQARGGKGDAIQVTHGAQVSLKRCHLDVVDDACHALLSLEEGTVIESSECHAAGFGEGFTVGRGVHGKFSHCNAAMAQTGFNCWGGKMVLDLSLIHI